MQPASNTAVAIFDRDGPCFPCKMGPAFQDTMALEMGPAFCARWAALRSQRASRFYAAVLPRAWRIPMPWLLGESSSDWRACDDMALAHSRDDWRSLPCSIACLLARQMVPEEGYIAGYYGILDGPCLPCKMGNAAADALPRQSRRSPASRLRGADHRRLELARPP